MTRSQPLSSELAAGVRESLDRWQVPGAAVGIVNHGRSSVGAFGVTSLETQQPVTPETLFRVASITKPFTATTAMTLVDDGLLDLDRPITEYLPGVTLSAGPRAWQNAITMRHLLSHTAGLDCELAVDLASLGPGDDALPSAIGLYGGVDQWAAPGEVMSYSNTGYWLAGHVIATVAGTTFEEAMRQRVLRRLGLQRTVFTAEDAIVFPVALGHQPRSPTENAHELIHSYAYPRARTPSGGVISTVVDLLEFARWHLGESDHALPLSSALRDAMRKAVVRLRSSDDEAWGVGWRLAETADGTPTFGHGGSYGGFQTLLTIVPSRRFAFVMLTNSGVGGLADREVERLALEHEVRLTIPEPRAVPRSRGELAVFAGFWRHDEATYEIAVVDDADGARLEVTPYEVASQGKSSPPVPLRAISDRDFVVTSGRSTGMRADFLDDPATGAPSRVRIGLRVAHRVG